MKLFIMSHVGDYVSGSLIVAAKSINQLKKRNPLLVTDKLKCQIHEFANLFPGSYDGISEEEFFNKVSHLDLLLPLIKKESTSRQVSCANGSIRFDWFSFMREYSNTEALYIDYIGECNEDKYKVISDTYYCG